MGKKRISPKDILNNVLAQHEEMPRVKPSKTTHIIGIDWGEKFCGFAFSPDGLVVLALEVCKTEDFEKKLQELIQSKKANLLVWGVPKSLNDNLVVKKVKTLSKKQKLPSILVDERGSSQLCITDSKTHRIDDLAAAQILEFYLNNN